MDKRNAYETLFIIDASLPEDAIKALTDKFTALIAENGTVAEINEWGKRHLAYPINDKDEGYYVLVNFSAEKSVPAELDRVYHITDGILRSLIVAIEK